MTPWLIAVAVFLGVSALVGGAMMLFHQRSENRVEDRLSVLAGAGGSSGKENKTASLLSHPLDQQPGLFDRLVERVGRVNVNLLFEQADVSLTMGKLLAISGVLAGAGVALAVTLQSPLAVVVLVALGLAALPIFWLLWRRRSRLKKFGVQLPDALEMLARALRAGQSLAAGFNLIATEIAAPLGKEFGRVFEEQNLGVPVEESLVALAERIPNLDLKFFSTAVILQRQTGGDLAEILDKIGSLVRERFKIWGQIQALTGEGRLSGVVLLGLPVVLFMVAYKLNPDYLTVLFTDPMGKRMLIGAVILQIIGALVIRKIVNIRV
jgi:tight adherence protein B